MALIEKDVKTIEELKTVIGHGGKAAVLYDVGTGEPYGLDVEVLINMDASIGNKVEKTTRVVAGSGLTGGGTLESDRTLNVVAADDSIVVAADNIKVNTVDALTSDSATRPLSAKQGKALNANFAQLAGDVKDTTEKAGASSLAELNARLLALEKIVSATITNKLEVTKEFNVWGKTNLILTGSGAATFAPDFIGQKYIDTTRGNIYVAVGVATAGNWKLV